MPAADLPGLPSWVRLASAVVVLPVVLVLVEVTAAETDVKVLLFPPLAAIGYRLFREEDAGVARFRSVVVGPVAGSLCGWGLAAAGGLQAWTVAVAVLAGILVIEILDAQAPPILAVALLALLVGRPDWRYPLAVLGATGFLYVVHRGWLRATRALGRIRPDPQAAGEPAD